MAVLTVAVTICGLLGTVIQMILSVNEGKDEYNSTREKLEKEGRKATWIECLRDKDTRPSELNVTAWGLLAAASFLGLLAAFIQLYG